MLLTRQESRSWLFTYFSYENGNLESIHVSNPPTWDKHTIGRVCHWVGNEQVVTIPGGGYFGKGNYISWKKQNRVEDL